MDDIQREENRLRESGTFSSNLGEYVFFFFLNFLLQFILLLSMASETFTKLEEL